MTHDELIKAAAEEVNEFTDLTISKTTMKKTIEAVFKQIFAALEYGGSYRLPGIGTLKTVDVSARTARNPATGETIQVPAKRTVKFKIASELKKALNE